MIIPVILLATISPALIFFGILLLVVGIFYLMVSVSLTFIVRAYENKGFFEAIGRSFSLVQGKWWSTFRTYYGPVSCYDDDLLYFPDSVVYGYIHFRIAQYIRKLLLQEPSTGWEMMTIVLFTLYYLAQMVLATLPNIGIAFQYFNLVELKEAKGLLNKISTLGQSQSTPSAPEEQF